MTDFRPKCLATAIGSFPHSSFEGIIDSILGYFPEIPLWPQLPRSGILENPYIQFSEGLPNFVIEADKRLGVFETSKNVQEAFKAFHPQSLIEDFNYFALSLEYAGGFHSFLEVLDNSQNNSIQYLKGHTIGPVSFGLQITDSSNKRIINNFDFFNAIVKGLTLKARWQVQELKARNPQVLIFINEPLLDSAGSNISKKQITGSLNEVISGIQKENALAGIHCSGAVDLSPLMNTDADIICFNYEDHFEIITGSANQVKKFLDRGGALGWGMIPATEKIKNRDVKSVVSKFESCLDILVNEGIDRVKLLEQSLVTPNRGTEHLSVDLSNSVMDLTRSASKEIRKKYWPES